MRIKKIILIIIGIISVFCFLIGLIGSDNSSNKESEQSTNLPVEEVNNSEEEIDTEPISKEESKNISESDVSKEEVDSEEYPNYVIEGNTYQGLYDEQLYLNLFPSEDGESIDFNIFKYDENGELIPEYCTGGIFIRESTDEEGNIEYVSDLVKMIYIAYDQTYYVSNIENSGYQIDMEFGSINNTTEEGEYDKEEIVELNTQQDVINFFADASNVGKTFNCHWSFHVSNFHDFRGQLGNSVDNSWYYITYYSDSGQSFSACLFGWSDENRIMDGSNIYVKGIYKSNQSVNADFDIMALEVDVFQG